MADQPSPDQKKKPLVSVERQYETDVSTGETEVRVFLKMYLEARDSGLLAALGDRMWRTLSCLATYMDENGDCYPSQDEMARKLGVRRENVNLRMKELLAFRFNDRPVISVKKTRIQTATGGRWANNNYRIHPISGFAIFDQKKPQATDPEASVRKIAHRPVCENPNTGKSHTNKTHESNQKVVNALPTNDHENVSERKKRAPVISDRALRATYNFTDQQLAQVHYLVEKQTTLLAAVDRNHSHYVKRAADAVASGNAQLLDSILGEFKQAAVTISVKSPPRYFHSMWTEALQKHPHAVGAIPKDKPTQSPHQYGFEPLSATLASRMTPPVDDVGAKIGRMLDNATERGFQIPDHIRYSTNFQAVARWWAELADDTHALKRTQNDGP